MSGDEFGIIVATLVRRNLNTVFGDDVDANEVTKEFLNWTQGNWWYITELAQALDKALGPSKKSGESRVITSAILERLRKVWVERSNAEVAGGWEGCES